MKFKRIVLSDEEKEFLRNNYLFLSDASIAKLFGYSNEAAVRKIRQLLGLKRTKEEYRKIINEKPIIIWIPQKYNKEQT